MYSLLHIVNPLGILSSWKDSWTQTYNKVLGLTVILLFVNILFHFTLWQFHVWNFWTLLSLLIIIIPVFLHLQIVQKRLSSQKKLIKQALSSSFTSCKFDAKSTIPEADFKHSQLFNNVNYFYKGNSLISKTNSDFSVSNIIVSHHLDKNANETPIFSGVLAKLKNPSYIDGFVLIKPIFKLDDGSMPELIKKLFQRYLPVNSKRAYSNHAKFDQEFEIYTNVPEKLKASIDSTLIDQLLLFKKAIMELMHEDRETNKYTIFTKYSLLKNSPLEISITGDCIYIGIRNMNLFNFHLEDNMEDSIIKSIQVLQLFMDINRR